MYGVAKNDVHVSFQRNRLIITWGTVEVFETEEDGQIVRERRERFFHRTLPLPEGTRVNLYYLDSLNPTFTEPYG
jgi:HSP20 family molecular chaperone IbpA